ncbi:flagellar biosynthesis protein FlhF [Pontibacillus yanchengensis]|uniref:Flagellar biosynthesis protein FlhF n=2 Tax=Pontibacillus yanchengensis TaxID=462910 RepID=A0ACC7VBQ3_9BACI|nr:flagellar biosynthesis protein FlhF [Pontibacillus yanchengensis]MYL33160.1 flagellar biosynthesis protein FlhF [Pontibacillus yanchengensis]MYL51990.1 flagellar biosynthesis protein FlhF [Pontibacillus yanchengensis]
MKVKKFEAPTMPEAMSQVRKELGNEAVILNSKEIQKGGFLGLFRKTNIQVIAAIDPQPKMEEHESKPKQMYDNFSKKTEQGFNMSSMNTKENDDIKKEIQELRTMMEQQSNQFTLYPAPLQKLYESLLNQELSKTKSKELIDPLVEKYYLTQKQMTNQMAEEMLREELHQHLQTIPLGGIDFSKQFVHIVGPTGVGKTTTIAKIAAEAVLKHKKKVAFITTDTFRIAAIDQLKTYAKILDVPIEVAYNLDDYKKARETFQNYDLVLVDTAGRNFRDPKYVKELQKVVDFTEDLETYLVLSITSKVKDLDEIFSQFSTVPLKKLIFTKVDETSQYGGMLELVLKHKVGVAYLTNGQNVPDDIKEASIDQILNRIVGEGSYE